jgi:hypothetical protein
MKKMTVRDFGPQDAQKYADWLLAIANINLVDCGVYEYPTCVTAVVQDEAGDPVLINSVHLVLAQEALAPKPGLSPKEEALALKAINIALKDLAKRSGVKEIWFECKDQRVIDFACRHDFEVIKNPVLRMKVQ